MAADQIANGFAYLRDGESEDARERRWAEQLLPVKQDADRALVNLRLETGTDDTVKAFIRLWNGFETYRGDFQANQRNPGSVPLAEMNRHRADLQWHLRLWRKPRALTLGSSDRPPVRVEVAPGYVGSEPYVIVNVYNDTDRAERVDTVALRMSDSAGDLIVLDHAPFPSPPQLATETQNYRTGFRHAAL